MVATVLTYAAAAAVLVVLPGPDTLVVVRSMLRGGRRQSALTAAGVLSGLLVWIVVASLGISAMLRASETGYTGLRLAGAAYLLWLGVQSLRSRATIVSLPDGELEPRRGLLGHGYVAGLATDLLNPKVGVFFLSFLPGFVPRGGSVGVLSFLFGLIFVVETAIYFVVLIALASRLTAWLTAPRTKRRLERVTGAVLIGFGLRLATDA